MDGWWIDGWMMDGWWMDGWWIDDGRIDRQKQLSKASIESICKQKLVKNISKNLENKHPREGYTTFIKHILSSCINEE